MNDEKMGNAPGAAVVVLERLRRAQEAGVGLGGDLIAATDHVASVTGLKTYKLARRASDALVSLLHHAEWLVRTQVEVTAAGEPVVVAVVTKKSRHIVAAVPRTIDGVVVQVRGVQSDTEAA